MELKSESGRSMVEMLGVLAIIGVLTVGGIAGYTFAMNKYRTNEVLDGASKRAITVATQLAVDAEPDLSEYANDNDVAGGTFSADVTEYDNGQFGLNISGVKKAVCEGLVKTAGGKVALRAIVDQDAQDASTDMTPADCKDENKLVLVFNNSASAKDPEEDRSGGDIYEDGMDCTGYAGGTVYCTPKNAVYYCDYHTFSKIDMNCIYDPECKYPDTKCIEGVPYRCDQWGNGWLPDGSYPNACTGAEN